MWGARWRGASLDDETSGGESPRSIVDAISYSDWLSFVTHRIEDEVAPLWHVLAWEELILKRKFGWAGHIVRRGVSRRTARVLAARESGKRRARTGRPNQRWDDSMVAFVGNDWRTTAADRTSWRYFCDLVPEFVRSHLI